MKKVYYNLLKIRGIGPHIASKICYSLGVNKETNNTELSIEQQDNLDKIMGYLKKQTEPAELKVSIYTKYKLKVSPIASLLNKYVKQQIMKQITANTTRGRRHKMGYPVKGQYTRSNGKTARYLNKNRI